MSDAELVGRAQNYNNDRQVPMCTCCKRKGSIELIYIQRYLYLRPGLNELLSRPPAPKSNSDNNAENESYVCLFEEKLAHFNFSAQWAIYFGATAHMCREKHLFGNLSEIHPFTKRKETSLVVQALRVGTNTFHLLVDGHVKKCKLHNVLYVPEQ